MFSSLPRDLERVQRQGPRCDLSTKDVDSELGAALDVQLEGRAEEKTSVQRTRVSRFDRICWYVVKTVEHPMPLA